jgi:hypothetical protein
MDTIEQTIRPHGSTTAGRLRIMVVVAVLVVGLLAGFGLGRAGGSSGVVPAWPAPVAHGPGHVPRVWVDQP